MELIGLKVKHAVFGVGTITDAFEKFIKAEDSAVQQAIVDEINDAKAATEQKHKAEEAAHKAAEEQRRAAIAVAATKAKKAKALDEMFAPD